MKQTIRKFTYSYGWILVYFAIKCMMYHPMYYYRDGRFIYPIVLNWFIMGAYAMFAYLMTECVKKLIPAVRELVWCIREI